MIQEIIARCNKAQQVIAAAVGRAGPTARPGTNAGDVLARLDGEVATAEGQLRDAAAAEKRLARFADASTASVAR